MKRYHIIYILFAASALLAAGCDTESLEPNAEKGPHITLTVSTPGEMTKADTRNGDDVLHENDVKSVYYFLYKNGETTTAPKLKGHFSGLSLTGSGATKTWTIPVSASTISNDLFPAGTRECNVVVIANPPASIVSLLEGTPTLAQVRAAEFFTDLSGTQDNFVMVYDGVAEVDSRTAANALEIDAKLKRVANKLTVKAKSLSTYHDTVTGFDWHPIFSKLKVEFYNGMNRTCISGDFAALKTASKIKDEDYYTSDAYGFGTITGSGTYKYWGIAALPSGKSATTLTEVPATPTATDAEFIKVGDDYYQLYPEKYESSCANPFYSYPMVWEFTDRFEPYLMFELPWTTKTSSTDPNTGITTTKDRTETCYYKMMLNDKSFATNGWYDITVELNVLGSFSKVAPTQQYLHEDYVILDWKDAFDDSPNVDAEIKNAKYLVVNETSYVLNNQTKLSIPFSSSDECDFEVLDAHFYKYGAASTPQKTDKTTDAAGWFTINGNVLEFTHTLHNQLDADMDCAPYDIDVKIKHKGDATYSQTIHITQYPAVYVTTQLNSNVTVTTSGSLSEGSQKGYLWINGANNKSGYQTVQSKYNSGSGIANPNMTIISVSQFSSDMDFIIGDPRTAEPMDLGTDLLGIDTNGPAEAPALYGTSPRKLTWYYPARTDAENYVAPKLRVVSGYAANGGDRSFDNNLVRCATYQEDGYPAGRWRLPTAAEILYMRNLAKYGFILQLFATGVTYWCSSGYVDGDNNIVNNTSGNHSSRCVYDEWYWEIVDKAAAHASDPSWRPVTKTTFTWGDQPLN